jgi:DNA-binding beta-propeller fold protein YncE
MVWCAALSAVQAAAAPLVALQDVAAQSAPPAIAQPANGPFPTTTYRALVASEAVDQIAEIELGPQGARVVRTLNVGMMLTDPDGPHGVAVSPDGEHFYVTTAHGTPNGFLWKYVTATHAFVARTELGSFPATAQVSADGKHIVVVNFNLHGEMVPSDVSIVRTSDMLEMARLRTCTMPHGSRISGTKHYSACMMDDQLVEIDVSELRVTRHFALTKGEERGMTGEPPRRGATGVHDMSGHGMTAPAAGSTKCSPTWAQPSPDGRTIWVACNGTSDLVEIDAASWTMRRRIPAGSGVYNLAVTSDGGRLVATNKRGQSVSLIDTKTGKELARIPTLRRVVHGAAITRDDRYVFVSVEGIGSEPGTVEIIDLAALKTIARVDVGQMAGGVDVIPAKR